MEIPQKDKRTFVMHLPKIPPTGTWAARMVSGEVVIEGKQAATWGELDHANVESYNILGMAVPKGHSCEFCRIASATPGKPATPHTLVFSAEKDGVIVEFKFVT